MLHVKLPTPCYAHKQMMQLTQISVRGSYPPRTAHMHDVSVYVQTLAKASQTVITCQNRKQEVVHPIWLPHSYWAYVRLWPYGLIIF